MLRRQKERCRDLRQRLKHKEYKKKGGLRIKAALIKVKVKVKKRKRKMRERKGLTRPGIFGLLLINHSPGILRLLNRFKSMPECWRACVILPLV